MGITKTTIRKIERHKAAIAKHRDELREILSDLESVEDSATRGITELDAAIAILSEYV